MYDEQMVLPMRRELSEKGVKELKSKAEVDDFMRKIGEKETTRAVVFINSVCGCAAGSARPAFVGSLGNLSKMKAFGGEKVLLATVFAGVDPKATESVRNYLPGVAPSSPSMAFFRGGKLVYFIDRQAIDGSEFSCLQKYIETVYQKFFDEEINEKIVLRSPKEMLEISCEELQQLLQKEGANWTIYDCRSPREHQTEALPQSALMTQELADEIIEKADLFQNTMVILYSNYGETSLRAVTFFKSRGLKKCFSLRGGFEEWKSKNFPEK